MCACVLGPGRPAVGLERVPRVLREAPQVEDEAGDDDEGEPGARRVSPGVLLEIRGIGTRTGR